VCAGQGGNDLLGKRKQVADQEMKLGNAALQGNIAVRGMGRGVMIQSWQPVE